MFSIFQCMKEPTWKSVLLGVVDFLFLYVVWHLFVSNLVKPEIYAGFAAAALGTVADQMVKAEGFARFRPKLAQVLLIVWQPYYAITGSAAVMKALLRALAGKPSEAQFRAVHMDVGGDDAQSEARRALMIAYMTMPPNFIVVGIDRKAGRMLVHQVSPTPTPEIAKKLGALE